MHVEVAVVNPELAELWLRGNTANRPIKAALVDDLTNAMLNGTFKLTHQPVAMTSEGRLLDGQHRLLAIVRSGRTVSLTVARDADPETFGVIDAGAKRTLADVLAVKYGHTYNAVNVAACRVVAMYDRSDVTSTAPWNTRTFAGAKLDRATIAALADEMHESMNRLILDIKDINVSWRLHSNPLAALYVIRRDSAQDAALLDEFIRGLVSGADIPPGDVRLKLRDGLVSNPAFKRFDARLGFFVTVKAWNLYVQGESPKILRFVRDSPGALPL